MDINCELYDKGKDYFTKEGQILTYEDMVKKYPAIQYTKMVVFLFGRTVTDMNTFDYLRGINRIKADVPDDEALSIIAKSYEDAETESTPLERIASSLEYLTMINLGGTNGL